MLGLYISFLALFNQAAFLMYTFNKWTTKILPAGYSATIGLNHSTKLFYSTCLVHSALLPQAKVIPKPASLIGQGCEECSEPPGLFEADEIMRPLYCTIWL